MILPLLPPSSLTQFNLVWIFLFHLPINLAKSHLQSGSLHNVQKLSNIKTTALNNGHYTKLRIQELYLYKLVTYAPKPSIMPNPLLSNASTIKLLHVKQNLAPYGLSQSCLTKILPFFFSTAKNNSGSSSCTPSSKSNLLTSTFASNSNLDDQDFRPTLYPTSTITMSPIKYSTRKVRKVLLRLNTSKSSGPDGIPAIVLKSCAPGLTPVLNKLFQPSYNLGIFPSSWKLAHIFPIPKKVTNLTLQTIALLQSLLSSLRLWRPSSPNNCLPTLKQTAFFLITNMGFDKPDLLVTF